MAGSPGRTFSFSSERTRAAATRRVSSGLLIVAGTLSAATSMMGARSAGTPEAAAMPFVILVMAARTFSRCAGVIVRTVSCKCASSGMMLCLVPAWKEPTVTTVGTCGSISRLTMDPQVPTVVTVGSFHAGTKHNIIPDEAHLQLTVRTMTPAQREKVLAAITRITNGVAEAAGIPAERAPIIEIAKDNVPSTINDPALTQRVALALEKSLGKENVWPGQPIMASEDFSLFALENPKPPITMFWLGAPDPAKWKEAQEKGRRRPGRNSAGFARLPEPAIRTGVKAMTGAATELLHK